MKRTASALFVLLLPALLAVGGLPAFEPAPASGDGSIVAQILAQVIYDSRTGQARERSYTLQEPDLNAFLRDQLEMQQPEGVERVAVELLPENSLITFLTVDMDQIDLGNGTLTGMLLGGLLSGKQKLELEGQLDARQGQGTFTPRRAELNGTAIPISLLNTLLKMVGERLEPPFDPTRPFRLPYGLQSIEISEGQVQLTTGPDSATP